ncbi:hypothetical protein [Streptomyces sp. NPDC006739]|uniref:hypothetical protein n=1 Tax=Streptomyces sp. NPDC006739 TaxID=3364763 RepID=UPI0036C1D49A
MALAVVHEFREGSDVVRGAVERGAAGQNLFESLDLVVGETVGIKMLKRQMFGRANFDLLRKRVLLSARGRS